MAESQCPICHLPLEVRDVAPCSICGGCIQPPTEASLAAEYREWRLPGGQKLTLCDGCELEEFLVPGGWGYRMGLGGGQNPIGTLQFVRIVSSRTFGKDKFCTQCNLRLSFLKVVAAECAHRCDACGRPMYQRLSRGRPYLGCSGFPECKTVLVFDGEGNPVPAQRYRRGR